MDKDELLSIIKARASKISNKQKLWIGIVFFFWLAQSLLWFAYPPEDGFLFNNFFIDPYT